jgi:hypothetical protein
MALLTQEFYRKFADKVQVININIGGTNGFAKVQFCCIKLQLEA